MYVYTYLILSCQYLSVTLTRSNSAVSYSHFVRSESNFVICYCTKLRLTCEYFLCQSNIEAEQRKPIFLWFTLKPWMSLEIFSTLIIRLIRAVIVESYTSNWDFPVIRKLTQRHGFGKTYFFGITCYIQTSSFFIICTFLIWMNWDKLA